MQNRSKFHSQCTERVKNRPNKIPVVNAARQSRRGSGEDREAIQRPRRLRRAALTAGGPVRGPQRGFSNFKCVEEDLSNPKHPKFACRKPIFKELWPF